jgi:hypothetical protein
VDWLTLAMRVIRPVDAQTARVIVPVDGNGAPWVQHRHQRLLPLERDPVDILNLVAALFATALFAIRTASGPEPAIHLPPQPSIAATYDARHQGHPLCMHHDVAPVAGYFHHYTDSLGGHYHGWLPPAGPPFYVQCFAGYKD